MTGYSTHDLVRPPGEPAADGLLQKPFTPEVLLEALRQAVDGRQSC